MTTHNKKKPVEEPETAPPDYLQIVSSELEPAFVTPPKTESVFDRLQAQYDTSHLPDTDTLTLAGGEVISFRLMKSCSDYTAIQVQAQLLNKLCEDTKRVEEELPDLLPFLPLDYLLIQDCCTVSQNLLPPYDMNFVQAAQLAKSCGNLIPELAATIRMKSSPDCWPKPPTTPTHAPESNGTVISRKRQ